LRRLAAHYHVYLGTFVDDPADWRHLAAVETLCTDTCVRPLTPWRTRWRALAALARGEAITIGAYRDRLMQRWVERLLAQQKLDLVVCYSSGVAPFVLRHPELRRVMDFIDVDSDKWRQYARTHAGLARWVYRREAHRLARLEQEIARRFDASLFVSEPEAAFFRQQVPDVAGKVHGIPNGVDSEYFDPKQPCSNPYPTGERVVVFVGAMDYRANVHAVEWFAREVWPQIVAGRRDARFYIVGSKPIPAVRGLGQHAGIIVTGRVADVRPYLAHAHAVVAPLQIARGIQNKVLEALAMEKVVLATPAAWEGIEDFAGRRGCIDRSPEVLAAAALRCLDVPQPDRVPATRAAVLARYDWAHNLDAYETVLRNVECHTTSVDAPAWGIEACP
jgi:sugar transferase (PEP-CTERM/EpsH1 system associated)